MTIIRIVDNEKSADVTLQIIDAPTEAMNTINGVMVSSVSEVVSIFLTNLDDEADTINDGILYTLADENINNTDDNIITIKNKAIKLVKPPIKVYIVKENYYIYHKAVPCRIVKDISKAGWRYDLVKADNLEAKCRLTCYRSLFDQVRPIELNDYVPKRYIYPTIDISKKYIITRVAVAVTPTISNEDTIITIIPKNTYLAVDKMCQHNRIDQQTGAVECILRIKLKHRNNEEAYFHNRVHDYIYGSDGWITYQSTGVKSCTFVDETDGLEHGYITNDNSIINTNSGCAYSNRTLYQLFPLVYHDAQFLFIAYKCPIEKESNSQVLKAVKLPRQRYFRILDGIVTYHSDNPSTRSGGKNGVKVPLAKAKVFIRKPFQRFGLDEQVPLVPISCLKHMLTTYSTCTTDEIEDLDNSTYNYSDGDCDTSVYNQLDILYICWNYSGGSSRSVQDNLVLFIKDDYATAVCNILGAHGAQIERNLRCE